MDQKMTQGPIFKTILMFTGPIFFSHLLQQFYNIIDTMLVGKILGIDALAGMGTTWALNYIVLSFCTGVGLGIGIPVAQQYGAKNHQELKKYFWNGLYVGMTFMIFLTFISVVGCRSFLQWSHVEKELFSYAYQYIIVIFLGIPFTILYNLSFGVMMGFGNSRFPSMILAISSFINLGLDLIFIIQLEMGVMGAALATVIANAFSAIICFLRIFIEEKSLKEKDMSRNIKIDYIIKILKISVPMGLQSSITAIGAVIMQTSINNLGKISVAAYSSGAKIKGLMFCPLQSLGNAISSFVGQNYGAKHWIRIRKSVRDAILLGFGYSIFALLIGTFGGESLSLLFLETGEYEAIQKASEFIMHMGFYCFIIAILFPVRFATQGMGYSRYTIFSGAGEMLTRILMAVFIVPKYGFTSVCFSEGLTFFIGILVIVPLFLHVLKKEEKKNLVCK